MKKVLIFGAVKHVIKKAKELGYETIVIDQNPNIACIKQADKFKNISFEAYEECLQYAREEHVDGVVTATEFAVLTASYVANKMNLPGLDFEVAKLVNAIYPNKQIYIDMPFIQYIFFKIKNRKVKLKYIKKCEEVDNALNIEDMLDFVADSYGVEFSIFAEAYETY